MQTLVYGVPRVADTEPTVPEFVEVALFDICLGAVDGLEGFGGVHDDGVGAVSELGAVVLLKLPKPDMAIAFVAVVEGWPDGELCKEGPRVLGKRVQMDEVESAENVLW